AGKTARRSTGSIASSCLHLGQLRARSGNSRTREWQTLSSSCPLRPAAQLSRPDPRQYDRVAKLRTSATPDSDLQSLRRTSRTDVCDAQEPRRAFDRSPGYWRPLLYFYLDNVSLLARLPGE